MSASTPAPNLTIAITTTGPASRHVPEFKTERLLCRPLVEEDWPEYHKMLQEEQTMINAGVGPMLFPRAARAYFDDQQEDWASVGIFARKVDDDIAEGEFIGTGGVYWSKDRLPEVCYVLKQRFWGKGRATEFLIGFLEVWWDMPRVTVDMYVETKFLDAGERGEVPERLTAPIKVERGDSQNVVKKAGFSDRGEVTIYDEKYVLFRLLSPK
ncbi:hypothetical protein IG631_19030 [Alternaria alternata]|nr:hypothetical protein IG631_19030 [Alternaria alternata]